MNTEEIENILIKILKDLGVPPDQIEPDCYIYQDLQLDSLEIVEVALAIKRKLGIKVKLETRQDKTLTELCSSIQSVMSAKTGSGIN